MKKTIGRKLIFHEAPELKTKVAAGKLPPVEERLPKEPLVVEPLEEIGQYGGTFKVNTILAYTGSLLGTFLSETVLSSSSDFTQTIPHIAKDWKISEDAKTITIYLRKGMKWSDGSPFTADDFLFWYEDILCNKSLTPVIPWIYKRGGEIMQMKKIDDYTVEFSFAKPYGAFVQLLGAGWGGASGCYSPKHYLKQFHPKYTSEDKLQKIMKKEGFDSWIDLFETKRDRIDNPELLGVGPFIILDEKSAPIQRAVRNPYYWQVDTKGNQLPYIDKIERFLVSDMEATVLKIMAGENDFMWLQLLPGGVENLPLLMQNREKGNYRLVSYAWMPNCMGNVMFNFNHSNPVHRELYRDKRFRIALSVAINREEVNKLVFGGMGATGQPRPMEGPPYHGESSLFQLYAEYNPKLANQLLDEIGLTEYDEEGYRLGPDGKKLRLTMYVTTAWPVQAVDVAELCKEYWAKIGIRVFIKPQGRPLWPTQHSAGMHDLSMRGTHCGGGPVLPICNGNVFALGTWQYAPKWSLWLETNGTEGIEPPSEVKQLRELHDKILAETSPQKRIDLVWKAFEIQATNLWTIGVVNQSQLERQWVISNKLGNIPEMSDAHGRYSYIGSWFFKK